MWDFKKITKPFTKPVASRLLMRKRDRKRDRIHKPNSFYLKGVVNPEFEKYLEDLEKANFANWSVPVLFDCPAKCNLSLTTSLQRIFWAGFNLLKTFKNYMDAKEYNYAKEYLKLQSDCWNGFFDTLVERYGNINQENAEEIEFNRNMLKYLFNEVPLEEFAEKFAKFINSAYKIYDPKNPTLKNS